MANELAKRLAEYLPNTNVQAFSHVVRHGETNQTDRAYYMVNGQPDLTSLDVYPYPNGLSTLKGGHACGAFQAIPSTWQDFINECGPRDFSKASQELFCIWALNKRHALADVVAGNLSDAILKCRQEWTSLPGANENSGRYNYAKAEEIFLQYGGTLGATTQPAAPITDESTTIPITVTAPKETSMGALALLQMFAGPLMNLIPQIKPILKPAQTDAAVTKTDTYMQLAKTILDTIVSTTKQPNLQAAVEAMTDTKDTAATKALVADVQKAVVTHPEVIQFMEVGGGFAAVRDADYRMQVLAQAPDAKPFWKTSAVFWISMVLLPMIYMYVMSSIAGGIEIPENWPWYAQLPLKMLGIEWDPGARVGLANLIVGLVLGGICGVYFGISVTQQKQSQPSPPTASDSGH